MYRLRDYQIDCIQRTRDAIRIGYRRPLLVLATGAGKTVIASHIMYSAMQRGRRVLFLAHRRELINQTSAKLDECGVSHGVIMSQHPRAMPALNVQVAAIPTLIRRTPPPADLVITDEAHHVGAATYKKLLDNYPDAVSLGLTATPYRLDGRGLDDHYDTLIEGVSTRKLIEDGWLVPAITYASDKPDLNGVAVTAGDFNRRQLGAAMDRPKLVGNLVKTYRSKADGLTAVYFAASIEHSLHIVQQFRESGISAEHLDGKTSVDERAGTLERLRAGETTVVSNYGILTEGYDLPRIGCIGIARPTMSRGLYVQMVGRGLRKDGSKDACIVLDHAGCCHRHGFIDDQPKHTLAGVQRRKKEENAAGVRVCEVCYAALPAGTPTCPYCGFVFPFRERSMIGTVDGELVEKRAGPYLPEWEEDRKILKYQELLKTAAGKNYKRRWADKMYQVLFGDWPSASVMRMAEQREQGEGRKT